MEDKKFNAVMMAIVPQIVQLIIQNYKFDEISASKIFYESQVYELLEQEDTKLWHLSPMMLFSMFEEERKNGTFEIPEEV